MLGKSNFRLKCQNVFDSRLSHIGHDLWGGGGCSLLVLCIMGFKYLLFYIEARFLQHAGNK